MNPNTRVSVHCYAGDGHQVLDALQLYTHHQCPLTIISPWDSPVVIQGVECAFAGRREGSVRSVVVDERPRIVTAGPIANERQVEQMKILLTTLENWFLMNDADSFCLAAKIPDYLYHETNTIWCNLAQDTLPMNQPGYKGYPIGFPKIALQPPYFAHRRVLEKFVAVAPNIKCNDIMPWIDHFMMQLAYDAKVTCKNFSDGWAGDLDRWVPSPLPQAVLAVRRQGKIFVHSSKSPLTWMPLVEARREYERRLVDKGGVRA